MNLSWWLTETWVWLSILVIYAAICAMCQTMHSLPIALQQWVSSFITLGILLRIARCFGPIPGHLISTGWCNPAWNNSLPDRRLQPIPGWEGEMLLPIQPCLFLGFWSRMAWLPSSTGYEWPKQWPRVWASPMSSTWATYWKSFQIMKSRSSGLLLNLVGFGKFEL